VADEAPMNNRIDARRERARSRGYTPTPIKDVTVELVTENGIRTYGIMATPAGPYLHVLSVKPPE
jgi:hypothetical protein